VILSKLRFSGLRPVPGFGELKLKTKTVKITRATIERKIIIGLGNLDILQKFLIFNF